MKCALASRRPGLVCGCLVLAMMAVGLWLAARQSTQQGAEISRLRDQLRQLEASNQRLVKQNQVLSERLVATAVAPPQTPAERPGPVVVSNLDQARLLVKLESELAAASRSLNELQSRLQELESQLSRAQEENRRLAASELELREKLAGQQRVVAALESELKVKDNRLVQLETTSQLLHAQSRQASEESARIRSLLRELEEINRRRESYSTSIARRYRELAEHLRTLAGRPEGATEARPLDSGELVRLQNVISAAEEDLRQLRDLNAQAARLERKLGKP